MNEGAEIDVGAVRELCARDGLTWHEALERIAVGNLAATADARPDQEGVGHLLVVPGRLPSLNQLINGGMAATGRLQSGKKRVRACIDDDFPRFDCCVFIVFAWFEKNRRRDKDNVSSGGRKIILDSLKLEGVIGGDGWEHVHGFADRFAVDKLRPRIEIGIYRKDFA